MTQPQQPFGPRCAAWPSCEEPGWVQRNGTCQWCPRAACAPPLVELCETLDTAGVLRRQADQIAALETTVAELRARLDDHLNRQAL